MRGVVFSLLAAALSATPALAGHRLWQDSRRFTPLSATAEAVTGTIGLSGNSAAARPGSRLDLSFATGASVMLTALGEEAGVWSDTDPRPIPGGIFRIEDDPGALLQGNRLCGDDRARYLVFSEGDGALRMAVFSSGEPPRGLDDPGLCAIFNYSAE